jgi:ketosteroid isomerase-like protein
MRDTSAAGLEATIREYFDGCNEADADKIMACFTEDAVHYFPAGAPQGTFSGAAGIAAGWVAAVGKFGSCWTIDRMIVDADRREAVIEWTHFKPKLNVYLRGDEWYVFARNGLIAEIRAYYACPTSTDVLRSHELGDFAYGKLGYPMKPPAIDR